MITRTDSSVTVPPVEFITPEQLGQIVPAAFATAPHEKVSDTYRFVPTFDIVNRLSEYGYRPVKAVNPVKKQNGKTGPLVPSLTGPHMIWFEPEVAQSTPEGRLQVVMINSHDRTKRFRLAAGFLRFACSNGLISGSADLQIRATHTDSHCLALDEQIEMTLTHASRLLRLVDTMHEVTLTPARQLAFAKHAMGLRFGDQSMWKIKPAQALEARRDEDRGDDLWRVFNRLQENLTKGGIHNENTPMPTFPLTRPRQTFNFNARLWELAETLLAE